MKILVTGGAGFIGSHLIDRLVNCGHDVRVLDNLSTGNLSNIESHIKTGKVDFIKGDINDFETVTESVKDCNSIAHLAAIVSVPFSVKNPQLTYETNIGGTLNLLAAGAQKGVSKFVFISSCAVYGDPTYLPIDEVHPTNPLSPYAESKLLAERYCIGFHERANLKSVIFRLFNVYGPRQGSNEYSGVITKFIDRLRLDQPLVIYGDGTQTRDFVHVSTVVEAIFRALNCNKADGEILNIGTGKSVTIKELAQTILDNAHSKLKISYEDTREGDIKFSYGNFSKLKQLLDLNAGISLSAGLQELQKR
ncbi:MAG: NAD-dependent epimerase/dehydratase family protein [Candidatus Bathyarchaeota archaeon]|nr:NAD-dependent epimerase/dehydratase family protein [Candidatus Bathyarchaeota archaeon]